MQTNSNHHHCHCCFCAGHQAGGHLGSEGTRREFLYQIGALTMGGFILSSVNADASGSSPAAQRHPLARMPLKVQPVLTYHLPKRREATSWREWGGLQTEADVAAEKAQITRELAKLSGAADFPLEILPLAAVQSVEQAAPIAKGGHDVLLMYAAGGSGRVLETLTLPEKWNLMFLRHQPGPVYLWYEIVHPRFLRKTVDEYGEPGMNPQDVVVDSQTEILYRLRALHGLKNTLYKRIVAVGGAGGWARRPKSSADRPRPLENGPARLSLQRTGSPLNAPARTARSSNAAGTRLAIPPPGGGFAAHHPPVREQRLPPAGSP